jgi:pre-rRNA-processing protein IPI1
VFAPSAANQFSHHISLLTSKSDTQRRDSLAYLTTYVTSRVVGSPLPQPTSSLLGKLCPLVLDGSGSVRTQTLKLLQALPSEEVRDHVSDVLPYIRAGMTHLAADIRASAVNVLSWLLDIAGEELVSCAGGWVKTLNCFVTTLGWHTYDSGKWSSNRATLGKPGVDGKAMSRNLLVLAEFLQIGIGLSHHMHTPDNRENENSTFPLWHMDQHMIPAKSNAYDYLNLFGAPRDDDDLMMEDREDRLRVFDIRFRLLITMGLDISKKEGGEIGRAAAVVAKVLKDPVTDD